MENQEPEDMETDLMQEQDIETPIISLKEPRRFFYCPRQNCGSGKLQLLYFDLELNAFAFVCGECGQFQNLPIPIITSTKERRPKKKENHNPSYV